MSCCINWCCFWRKPKPESEYLFAGSTASEETILETTERFVRLIPQFGVSLDAFELKARSHRALCNWTAEDCTDFYRELRKVHVLLGGKWRLHSKGGRSIQIISTPTATSAEVIARRTLFGGVRLSVTDRGVTQRLHESYGSCSTDQYDVSLDEPRPFWEEKQVLIRHETVQVVYPKNPIDIDGYRRHFIIVTKHNSFGEIGRSVFSHCLECIRYLVRHLAKGEDEVHILAGGNLDGSVSISPWHIQLVIFEPLTWNREMRTVQNALRRDLLSESDYEERMKDFVAQLPLC